MLRATALLAFVIALVVAPPALAVPTVTRAELNSGNLRVEGRGAVANGVVTVASQTAGESSVSRNADSRGEFRIETSGFRASTCRVDVGDATGSTAATLSGCTPSTPPPPPPPPPPAPPPPPPPAPPPPPPPPPAPPPPPPPPPPATCSLTVQEPGTGFVGTLMTYYVPTSGCRTSEKPVQCSVAAGQAPPGLRLFTQGVGTCGLTGTPTTAGVFNFTLRVKDQTGASDTESFSITINPPRPVVITNASDTLTNGTVGQFYCCGNLFADGGVPGYTWTLRSGQLPPGLSLSASPGRITGTPTARGAFTFLVRATDTRGAFAERTFTINVF